MAEGAEQRSGVRYGTGEKVHLRLLDCSPHPSIDFSPAVPRASGQDRLIELIKSPACFLDATGRVERINSTWLALSGVSASESGNLSWVDLVAPEDHPLVSPHFPPSAHLNCPIEFECRLRTASKVERWFLVSRHPPSADHEDWLYICADIHRLKCREQELEELGRLHVDLLNVSIDCIKLISPDGTLLYMNKAGCEALGVPENSSFGMKWLPLLPKEAFEPGQAALAQVRDGNVARFTGCSRLPDQDMQIWDNVLTPVKGCDGSTKSILCVSRNTTAERIAETELRESRERLTIASRVGGLGIWDYDVSRDILTCDETWQKIVGCDSGNSPRCIDDFRPWIHPDDADRATEVQSTAAELIAQNRDYAIVFRIIRPDGEIRWVRSAACLIQDLSGTVTRAIGFIVDITETLLGEMALRDANRLLEEERNKLARENMEDPLTQIANRRYLDGELASTCRKVDRTNEVIAVGMIDVDYFKNFNDHYGHLEGDRVLAEIATTIRSVARQCDCVARYGGEEFAFILHPSTEPTAFLERLLDAVNALDIPHEKSPYGRITISCGCVVQADGVATPTALLHSADSALYRAKVNGRNCYTVRYGLLES